MALHFQYRRCIRGAVLLAAGGLLAACGSMAASHGEAAARHHSTDAEPSTSSPSPGQTTTTSTIAPVTTVPVTSKPSGSVTPTSTVTPAQTTVPPKTLATTVSPGTTTVPSTSIATAPPDSVTIASAQTSVGTVLVDGFGSTLYLLTADHPTSSNCTSFLCNTVWPPVLATGGGVAGTGVQQALLGTLRLPNGTEQVTYAGHPLYTYVGDRKPGQTTGQGISSFGGIWWVLSATTGAAIIGAKSPL